MRTLTAVLAPAVQRNRSTDPTLTYEAIDAQLLPTLAALTVAQLRDVAKIIGMTLTERTKRGIVAAMRGRIADRKGSFERCQFRS